MGALINEIYISIRGGGGGEQFLAKAGEATRKCSLDSDSSASCPKALEIVSLVTSYANTLCHKPGFPGRGMYLELISVAKVQFTENNRPAYML